MCRCDTHLNSALVTLATYAVTNWRFGCSEGLGLMVMEKLNDENLARHL